MMQASEDVSPAKWHLAHTTWFFEQFILKNHTDDYVEFSKDSNALYNSYYETQGKIFPKSKRGLISRPTVAETLAYREYVEQKVEAFLLNTPLTEEIADLMEVGLQHEQQHQELLITDTKYNFSINPTNPAVFPERTGGGITAAREWLTFEEGLTEIGTNNIHFSFDNERPVHKYWIHPFSIASVPVTNREYIEFIEDGGYTEAGYWLSEGWAIVKAEQWTAPLYWEKHDGEWYAYSLQGLKKVNPEEPVTHISYYEADAFSRWAGFRLPTEQEWEYAFRDHSTEGHFVESETYHPAPVEDPQQVYGNVWEWTRSPYAPYPNNRPLEGALGEYNAKFMSNQMVLRGGSCATPQAHIRSTYRNFFPPEKRWQFSGIRLARNE